MELPEPHERSTAISQGEQEGDDDEQSVGLAAVTNEERDKDLKE